MRPFTSTIPFSEALRLVVEAAVPMSRTERVALTEAGGRVLAHDLVAATDVPPFNRAAMDGYAVIAADTAGSSASSPRVLRRIDRVFTGQAPRMAVTPGTCIEVATGAPMPDGADAVVMVEDTDQSGEQIGIRAAVSAGLHIGRRGADLKSGDVVVRAGDVISPARVGAIAATGATGVDVFARPSVALLSTGNEIVEPGQPLAPGHIYDINRFTLGAIVERHGGIASSLPIAGDTVDDLSQGLDRALGHDVIVFSGGSSVGERDLILDVLRQRGTIRFHGVAVKPGKPTAFGSIGTTPVFGMPGYPTSCLSNGYMLLVPFLRRVARLPPWTPRTIDAPLARRVTSASGRHQFYTVRLVKGIAEPAFKASGDITSMANADGYFEIDSDVDAVEAGTQVTITLFD
ncbi:MAG TPA: gephyrin-like molybdotransferase Glp [Vicinamibacterales bacterium]|nr:gephyrin-like molybdotransferase Glp [Vicinamibacterales bacterium]